MKGVKIGDILDSQDFPKQAFEFMVLGDQRYALGHYQGLGYLKLISGTRYIVDSIPYSNLPSWPINDPMDDPMFR